jgi:ribosomal protein S18 acetylase RimI-like enzyme
VDAGGRRTDGPWLTERDTLGGVDTDPVPTPPGIRLHWAEPGDESLVLRCSDLFDGPARPDWTTTFLQEPTHHLVVALEGDTPVGFISGVEVTHPDKGTEMFLYELATHEDHRRKGIARALIRALVERSRERGYYDVFVATEPDNAAAIATYRDAGFNPPDPVVMLTLDL